MFYGLCLENCLSQRSPESNLWLRGNGKANMVVDPKIMALDFGEIV